MQKNMYICNRKYLMEYNNITIVGICYYYLVIYEK